MANLFFNEDNLFDSHCHLNDGSFDADRDEVVKRATENGIEKIVDIAVSLDSSRLAVENARKYPGIVFAAVGIDPENLVPGSDLYSNNLSQPISFWEAQIDELRELISQNREYVVAVGESGMDAYWLEQKMNAGEVDFSAGKQSLKMQEELFELHLQLAGEFELPLSIHSRAAEKHCLEIAKRYPAARGVFHSYTGDYETAKSILDAGWVLGMNGIVTFKNADALRAVYKKLLGEVSSDWSPADFYAKGVYFETDAPYLAPEGKRGQRNEPGNVKDVYAAFVEKVCTQNQRIKNKNTSC